MRFPLGFGMVCWLGLLLGIAKKVLIGGSRYGSKSGSGSRVSGGAHYTCRLKLRPHR